MHTSTYLHVFIKYLWPFFLLFCLFIYFLFFSNWQLRLGFPSVTAAYTHGERGGDFSCTTREGRGRDEGYRESKGHQPMPEHTWRSPHQINNSERETRKNCRGNEAKERERGGKERMNDGRPSLLRLITCPSFVRVYFRCLIYPCSSCFASLQ